MIASLFYFRLVFIVLIVECRNAITNSLFNNVYDM